MEEKYPRVSVIINSHNGAKYLKEAIESVYAQTYADWEIVLYDNFSTDQTESLIKYYDEKLRYFRSERFLNLGQARNEAIKQARGEIIGFLDSDDIWLPEKLKKQLPLFQDPKVGIVHANVIFFLEGTRCNYILHKEPYPPRGYIFRDLFKNYNLTLGAVLMRRKCLDDIEWFPEDMNYCEEFDLFLRVAYSWRVDYVKEPLFKYRRHNQACSVANFKIIPQEYMRVLERLHAFIPDIEKTYSEEVSYFRRTIKLQEAVALWNENKREEARKRLLELFKKYGELKPLMFFFLTFVCSFEKYSTIKHNLKYLKEKIARYVWYLRNSKF
jgi:glycosyltransferase involved in cell wall biosynthesis